MNKSNAGDLGPRLAALLGVDDDDPISVDSFLARGRRENAFADVWGSPDSFVTRREPEARLVRAVRGIPNGIGCSNSNRTTLKSLQTIVRDRQPLLLVSDRRCAEGIRDCGCHLLHLPGLRSTRKIRRWLRDLASIVNGTYILVTSADVGRWAAYRLGVALLGCNDCFITYVHSGASEVSSSLRTALNRAVSVGYCDGVEGVDDPEALLLLFVDRFGIELKQDPDSFGVSQVSLPRGVTNFSSCCSASA